MGKSLQDRIKGLESFRPDITFKDGTFILKIKYKGGWTILKPQDPEKVAFAEDNNTKGVYWYVSNIEDTDLVFDLIEETINVNKEYEKKIELYKQKVQELKDLFLSDETYERLATLQFIIPTKAKKKPTKATKKSESVPEVEQVVESSAEEIKVETPTEAISDIDKKIAKVLHEN